MKILKRLAKKLAQKYLSEDELASLFIKSVESVRMSKEEDKLLFDSLRAVEGFQDYLSNTIVADKDRYWGAGSPMEQLLVKGASNRTLYLRSKLREKKDDDDKGSKLSSTRHE